MLSTVLLPGLILLVDYNTQVLRATRYMSTRVCCHVNRFLHYQRFHGFISLRLHHPRTTSLPRIKLLCSAAAQAMQCSWCVHRATNALEFWFSYSQGFLRGCSTRLAVAVTILSSEDPCGEPHVNSSTPKGGEWSLTRMLP